ncbi:DUF5134 domain-containing protein [Actinacidiphila acidipaludis]|uniref:DUF5134 domain-containing protein n=1 Tax=Actinacidiphila acidipaludis TaxID=2873382 RepID=A0ABS7QMI4_9ACTN|nr:DUF5134 domain-containing protein [Streptomyces acidipaludis]MBY8883004.1 DUF5134 domain-containing protein [Streptomyces acidipaludis]
MHGPPLVSWLLVALSTAAAVSCLLRGEARDEALTGAGMAVMAVPLSVFDPGPWVPPLLAAVFTGAALHSVVRRRTHRVHHTVCSAAMAYMALAMTGSGAANDAHAGHHAAGSPALTGVLLLYFAGYVLLTGTRVAGATPHGGLSGAGSAHLPPAARPTAHGSPASPASPTAPPVPHRGAPGVRLRQSPEVALACRVSMALGMVAMLLLM